MERLEQRIERFLRTGEGDFDGLAVELFSYQFERNRPYQAYCQALGVTPREINDWSRIPAVPIVAFKSTELATFPINQAAAVFHSSGTTRSSPSRHYLKTLTYYESALTTSFARYVQPKAETTTIILAPPPGEVPHSSLTWMLDVVRRRWGNSSSGFFLQRGHVDTWRLYRLLAQKCESGEPLMLLGTTLGFLRLFEDCERDGRRFVCPAGSLVMDTGGMKTAAREVSRAEFLSMVQRYLGISKEFCINEYGMAELSSQFYARGESMDFMAPTWVRTVAVDLLTGTRAAPGKSGLLRHIDLANVDSVMAIQTEDLGIETSDGFLFMGRAPAASLKGCSIDLEMYLGKAR